MVGPVLYTSMSCRSNEHVGVGKEFPWGHTVKETLNKPRWWSSLSLTQGVQLESLVQRYTSAVVAPGRGPSFNRATLTLHEPFLSSGGCESGTAPSQEGLETHQGTMTPRLCPWLIQNPGSRLYEDGKGPPGPYSCLPSAEHPLRALLYSSSFGLSFLETALSLIAIPSTSRATRPTEFLFTWGFPWDCFPLPLRDRSLKAEAWSPANQWWGLHKVTTSICTLAVLYLKIIHLWKIFLNIRNTGQC